MSPDRFHRRVGFSAPALSGPGPPERDHLHPPLGGRASGHSGHPIPKASVSSLRGFNEASELQVVTFGSELRSGGVVFWAKEVYENHTLVDGPFERLEDGAGCVSSLV